MQLGLPSLLCTILVFTFLGSSKSNSVLQSINEIHQQEGDTADMDCSISVSYRYYVMDWYRRPPNGEMTHIINIYSERLNEKKGRYTLVFQKEQKALKLTISALRPSDSAVYFCAVRDEYRWDWTAQLHFGRGTQLIVEPKPQPPAKPSVFVMKNGTNVACLVKDFYPKTVNISLQSSKVIKEYNPSVVLSPSGKYSAVKLGQYEDSDSVTCSVQHNSAIVNSVDFAPKENSLDNVPDRVPDNVPDRVTDYEKTTESKNKMETSVRLHKPKVHIEKVNMMSLTILGLRMLFAKSVAINFLLTAKLFFF